MVVQRHQLVDNSRRRTDTQFAAPLPKRTLIFLALALASFLLVIGIWLLTRSSPNLSTASSSGSSPALLAQGEPTAIQDRVSVGNRILITKESGNPENSGFEAAKEKGIAAMETENYQQAEAAFSEAIQKFPNAPETLIYLNNARIGSKKFYMVAASVPITGPSPSFASEMLRGFA